MRKTCLLILFTLALTACHHGVEVEGVALNGSLATFATELSERGYHIDSRDTDGYMLSGTYYGHPAFIEIESDGRGGVGRVLYDMEDVPRVSGGEATGFERIYSDFCDAYGSPDTCDTIPHPYGDSDIRCSWEPAEDTHIHMDYELMTDGDSLSHELSISYWKI